MQSRGAFDALKIYREIVRETEETSAEECRECECAYGIPVLEKVWRESSGLAEPDLRADE